MSEPVREPLRIGLLGAARITERSLIDPARATGHRLVAVAARDRARAEAFAAGHGVERVAGSYAELVADPEIDVVYNPLANGLHGPWNLAALAAGKHVLSEKPSASNTEEAAEVRQAAQEAGTVFMEAFHYLFHPVTRRLHELLASGELGELRHAEAMVAIAAPPDTDPRWSLPLAGGALMDLGCYGLHALRMLAPWAGGAPRPAGARGGERAGAPGVDEWLDADLEFPGGATGSARCHMAYDGLDMSIRIVGSRGEATAANFVLPQLDDRIVVRTPEGERTERLGTRSSYTYQLEAFAARVREGAPLPLDADDAVTTMELIDAFYRKAGFDPRPRTRI
ncbi:Gfo/Idh/MocA family protein [Streptomyces sp. NPDC056948]|uniref:Gfo/Idh/MocA family protein n=1 Tax=Streptomyces sp. NPDC056948 TaxID=3345975 RepID=UPI00363ADF3F